MPLLLARSRGSVIRRTGWAKRGQTRRTLPEGSVGLSLEGSQVGCAPAGITISGISVSSITGPAGASVDTGLVAED